MVQGWCRDWRSMQSLFTFYLDTSHPCPCPSGYSDSSSLHNKSLYQHGKEGLGGWEQDTDSVKLPSLLVSHSGVGTQNFISEPPSISENGTTSVNVGYWAHWSEEVWVQVLLNSATLSVGFLLYKSETKKCPQSAMLGCVIVASEWAGERVQLTLSKKNINSFSHAI